MPSGNFITLNVEPTDKIIDIKSRITDKERIAEENQQLFLYEDELSDCGTIEDYQIPKIKTMTCVVRLTEDN